VEIPLASSVKEGRTRSESVLSRESAVLSAQRSVAEVSSLFACYQADRQLFSVSSSNSKCKRMLQCTSLSILAVLFLSAAVD
jgi:hypothetical protein